MVFFFVDQSSRARLAGVSICSGSGSVLYGVVMGSRIFLGGASGHLSWGLMCPAWGGDVWTFLCFFKPQRASLRAQSLRSLGRIVAVAGLTLDAWHSVASWMVHVWHGLERRVRNMSSGPCMVCAQPRAPQGPSELSEGSKPMLESVS